MKTLLISILASLMLLIGIDSHCQEKTKFKITSAKLFLNGSWKNELKLLPYEIYDEGTSYSDNNIFEIGYPSVAIEINQQKSLRHEFEIMPIRLNYTSLTDYVQRDNSSTKIYAGSGKSTRLESVLGYQLKYYFRIEKAIVPMIGASSELYYSLFSHSPIVSYKYSITEQIIGIRLSVVPGLLININESVAIEINLPFNINTSGIELSNVLNPNFTAKERKSTSIFSMLIPKYYSGRVGVAYKFN